jgi:hypothetical protein
MKAKRVKPGQIVNPYYSAEARRETIARGKVYDVKPFLDLPIGEEVDDADCWKLCLGNDAPLQPADDECSAKVLDAMGSEKRLAFLRNLKRQDHPDVRRQMGKSQIEWLDSMLDTYGGEIAALDSKPVAKSKPAVPPASPTSPSI